VTDTLMGAYYVRVVDLQVWMVVIFILIFYSLQSSFLNKNSTVTLVIILSIPGFMRLKWKTLLAAYHLLMSQKQQKFLAL
jgi:hypothetical protein